MKNENIDQNAYLSLKEIHAVQEEAKKRFYQRQDIMLNGSKKLSIRGIGKDNDIILIYGNDELGYKHIYNNHFYSSKKPLWDNGKLRANKKSRFHISTSIHDLMLIAENIIKPDNKWPSKNPDKLDMYEADYKYKNLEKLPYRIITYKDTGIIHTFFIPDEKDFKKNRKLNYAEGEVRAKWHIDEDIEEYQKSYYDEEDNVVYKIIKKVFTKKKVIEWYLFKTSENEEIFIEREDYDENIENVPRKMIDFDLQNMLEIEKEIKKKL